MRHFMKTKILSIILIIFTKLLFSQSNVPSDYKKIPDSLYNKTKLYKFIVPKENYNYWKVVNKESQLPETLIYQTGSLKNLNDAILQEDGFFYECEPSGCFSYIVAYKKEIPKYFKTETELQNFIGEIDNLPEALLLARTYDFWFDRKQIIGGAYKIDSKYVYLYLSKFSSCPVNKESFIIKINRKNKEIKYQSNGVYYKTNDCYSS